MRKLTETEATWIGGGAIGHPTPGVLSWGESVCNATGAALAGGWYRTCMDTIGKAGKYGKAICAIGGVGAAATANQGCTMMASAGAANGGAASTSTGGNGGYLDSK
jgi:hypothetical protein